jgi:DNA-binding transcriptional ArsR family regulator
MTGPDATIDATFRALADPTRRGVIELLRTKPRRASDLADACGCSRPAMSRHLRVLRAGRLVVTSSEEDARERIYTLRPEPFRELRDWLEHVEKFWALQLDSFKQHVERTRGRRR